MSGCCTPAPRVILGEPPPPETQLETRIGAERVEGGQTVNIQARVAAQGGTLQSVVVTGGPPNGTGGCTPQGGMGRLITSDGTAWVGNGQVIHLQAADPQVGIVGPAAVQACNPDGRADVFWTWTAQVNP